MVLEVMKMGSGAIKKSVIRHFLKKDDTRDDGKIPWYWGALQKSYKKQEFKKQYREITFELLLEYVMENSRFYQEKLKGIDLSRVKEPADLGDFFTTARDFEDKNDELLCARPYTYFETSGSKGKPKKMAYTAGDIALLSFIMSIGFTEIGLKKEEDVYLNAFSYCLWLPGLLIHKGLEIKGIPVIPVGHQDPSIILDRIFTYKPTVVGILPSSLILITKLAEKYPGKLPTIKYFETGGQHISPSTRRWIESVWNSKVINGYGSTELGGVFATECFDGKGYHFNDTMYWVEIINQDMQGFGELVVTTLNFRGMPLIRYRTGDITRFIDDDCSCSIGLRKIDYILSRADEMFDAAGMNLYPEYFEMVVSQGAFLGIELDKLDELGRVSVVVLEGAKVDIEKLDTVLLNTIKRGEIMLEVKYVKPASIKTRKIPRIIDMRI